MVFAVYSTNHAKLQTMPGKLFSGRNMILNTTSIAYWGAIVILKQQIIDKNNQNENIYIKPHIYRVCEKVLVRDKKAKNMRSRTRDLIQ